MSKAVSTLMHIPRLDLDSINSSDSALEQKITDQNFRDLGNVVYLCTHVMLKLVRRKSKAKLDSHKLDQENGTKPWRR